MNNFANANEISQNEKSKRSLLRRELRAKRQNLTTEQQAIAAQAVFLKLKNLKEFIQAKAIAIYLSSDGEIDLKLLIDLAHQEGKQCYLPVISQDDKDELIFTEYKHGGELQKNRYLIDEPLITVDNTLQPARLDVVFMPLVGFDTTGTRLGMGKAYYDRCFAFLNTSVKDAPQRPKLIGVAHECQRVENLQAANWDVPLEKIVTDQAVYKAK